MLGVKGLFFVPESEKGGAPFPPLLQRRKTLTVKDDFGVTVHTCL